MWAKLTLQPECQQHGTTLGMSLLHPLAPRIQKEQRRGCARCQVPADTVQPPAPPPGTPLNFSRAVVPSKPVVSAPNSPLLGCPHSPRGRGLPQPTHPPPLTHLLKPRSSYPQPGPWAPGSFGTKSRAAARGGHCLEPGSSESRAAAWQPHLPSRAAS